MKPLVIFAFDFDGTLSPAPGGRSKIYSLGRKLVNDTEKRYSREQIALKMKKTFNKYYTKKDIKLIRGFFEAIHRIPNAVITIQSNNYQDVVLACLCDYIGIPIEWINLEHSNFRLHVKSKSESIAGLFSEHVQTIYYFEDNSDEISRVKNAISPEQLQKLRVINTYDGVSWITRMLDVCDDPVNSVETLMMFLEKFGHCLVN